MSVDEVIGLTILLTLLMVGFGLAAWASDRWCERNRGGMPPHDPSCERNGSVEEFYRTRDSLHRHRRRWMA